MFKKLKNLINKIFYCKYYKECVYFDESSVVCKGGGGNYCGQYRELNQKVDESNEKSNS